MHRRTIFRAGLSTLVAATVAATMTSLAHAQQDEPSRVAEEECLKLERVDQNGMDMQDPAVQALQQDCLYQAEEAASEPLIESSDIPDYSDPEPKPKLEKIEPGDPSH